MGIAGGLTLLTILSYFLVRRFQNDRLSAMTYREQEPRRSLSQEQRLPDGRTVTTYNSKDLEEARKKGKIPKGVEAQMPSQATAANDAAVQRTLRTLEEINRVNEMNRRLQEQQQRRK